MKVKIGNKIYDSEKQPIMLILSEQDKNNINNMHPKATKFCSFPANTLNTNHTEILKWMDEPGDKVNEMDKTLFCIFNIERLIQLDEYIYSNIKTINQKNIKTIKIRYKCYNQLSKQEGWIKGSSFIYRGLTIEPMTFEEYTYIYQKTSEDGTKKKNEMNNTYTLHLYKCDKKDCNRILYSQK